MKPLASLLCALFLLVPPAPAQVSPGTGASFPPSTATAEGVSRRALSDLDDLVRSFVEDGEVVGAELLVIRNGRSILHEAYGLRDQESAAAMETDSVFCVRSMTKPLIATAILMLAEQGRLSLDDPVSRHLPAFGGEHERGITVRHLLTHTSGLPFSLIAGVDPRELEDIQTVAALGVRASLEFEPGTGFQYSDQGTDTLTALIEAVTDVPAEDYVTARLLVPLGMGSSTCLMSEGHPLRKRTVSKHSGSRGAWTRFWSPEDRALFPVFLGSQGLYASLADYARFLQLWMDQGRRGDDALLSPASLRAALTPGAHPFPGSTGFPGLTPGYGSLMQVYTRPSAGDGEPLLVAFGHSGSDGTYAWAFPEQDAMALYFTQSRGTPTGLEVEEALARLFLGAAPAEEHEAPPLEDYLGYYRDAEDDLYRAIVRDGDDLALEVVGRAVATLVYVGEDSWKLKLEPDNVLDFERSASGEVTGFRIREHREYRFEPEASLPTAQEIVARVGQAHHLDRVESLGPVGFRGELTIERAGVRAETSSWIAWPDRFRIDVTTASSWERMSFDGRDVRYESPLRELGVLQGPLAETIRLDNVFARHGDLLAWYPGLHAIQRLDDKGQQVLLVRTGDTSAPASTFFIEVETGRVRGLSSFPVMSGLGRVGMQSSFGDFRDVSGMLLPFRSEHEVAHPFIGTIEVAVTDIEVGVELPEGGFDFVE